MDNLTAGDWGRCNEKVNKLHIDLSKLSLLELANLLKSFEDVYHLAAVKLHNEENSLESILASNVNTSSRLFEASGIAGVKNVFFSSSLYTYGSMGPNPMRENDSAFPSNHYGASKLFGELSLEISARKYGFRGISGRFFFIYGPKQYAAGGYKSVIVKNMEYALREKSLEINGDGNQGLDYVYIDDCLTIIQKLMDSDFNGVVNISSGEARTINQLISAIQLITQWHKASHVDRDFTHGSIRIGSTSKLQSIIGPYEFLDFSEGLERTWNSIQHSVRNYE